MFIQQIHHRVPGKMMFLHKIPVKGFQKFIVTQQFFRQQDHLHVAVIQPRRLRAPE